MSLPIPYNLNRFHTEYVHKSYPFSTLNTGIYDSFTNPDEQVVYILHEHFISY